MNDLDLGFRMHMRMPQMTMMKQMTPMTQAAKTPQITARKNWVNIYLMYVWTDIQTSFITYMSIAQ